MSPAGYLVVLRNTGPSVSPRNPRYRGLYRVPPFSQERFEQGFDDPYLLDPQVTPEGLLPTPALAESLMKRFADDYRRDDLEVIAVRTIAEGQEASDEAELERLGFDVAALSPFWSVLADIPTDASSDRRLAEFLALVNDNGLLPDANVARAYREYFTSITPDASEIDLYVWDVRVLQNTPEPADQDR